MSSKEKAAYLIVKYMSKVVSMQVAKECALVAVNELIEWDDAGGGMSGYLIEVREEIEKA